MLMALGSSWFGLLFLGSGSTFGSTSPPISGGAILPLYPSSFFGQLTQKASPGPAATLAWPNEGITADPSFGLPVAAFPASSVRPTPRSWPRKEQRRAKNSTTSPLSPLGLRRRSLNFEGGGRHSWNFKRRGSLAGRPERRLPTALAGRWFPSDWEGKHSRNFRRSCSPEQYPISYYNGLFVWNQACHRQLAHFHLIGGETQIGRRAPSIVQSNG